MCKDPAISKLDKALGPLALLELRHMLCSASQHDLVFLVRLVILRLYPAGIKA
jgi:hypothetical protein